MPASRAALRPPTHISGQFIRFVGIGVGSTFLDALTYHFALAAMPIGAAKALGYVVGATFSIACNYRLTFGHAGPGRNRIIAQCVLLYVSAIGLNVLVNRAALMVGGAVLPVGRVTLVAAFLAAVGVCTIYNFSVMRFWIFRARPTMPPPPVA